MTTQAGATDAQFQHLFTPLKIGSFTVRNRIVSTAHLTGFADQGLPSERHLNYWVSKAKGGIGLIVTEDQAVHPTAATDHFVIHAYRDECIEPFRRITSAVHEHGAKIVAQLWHPGSIFYGAREGSVPLVLLSAAGNLPRRDLPRHGRGGDQRAGAVVRRGGSADAGGGAGRR